MKIDVIELVKLLQDIQKTQGSYILLWSIFLLILIFFIGYYIKVTTKTLIEETSKQNLSIFENKLSEELQTKIGLFFRDENVRNGLTTYIGQKSVDKKIENFQTVHKFYFKYQSIWSFTEKTLMNDYENLDIELNNMKEAVFNDTIFIGYFLSQKLVRTINLMRENVRLKATEFRYSGKNYDEYNRGKLEGVSNRLLEYDKTILENLEEMEIWLMKNIHSDKTVEHFEFSQDQVQQLKEERNKKFDKIVKEV